MKDVLSILFTMLLAVTLVACDSNDNGDGETPSATAEVRFVHASPNAGPVTISVDGNAVAEGVAFSPDPTAPAATDYVEVPLDIDAEITVTGDGGNNAVDPVAVDGLGLSEDERYTVIVAGDATEANAPEVILLGDSGISAPPAGAINLRLVHGAATFGDVDVFLVPADSTAPSPDAPESAPLINDLTFGADFPGSALGSPGAFTDLALSGDPVDILVTDSQDRTDEIRRIPINSQGGLQLSGGEVLTAIAVDTQFGGLVVIDTP